MASRPLEPFAEWGGRTWLSQLEMGLDWLGDIDGLRVLDLGTRRGRMATWFALEGASVVGLDLTEDPFGEARRFASDHGVAERITFATYSGDPRELPGGFDIVFSKSVLVLMEIGHAVDGLSNALGAGGRLLLVENARGPLPLHWVRMVRRMSRRPHGATYFTPETLQAIRRRFDVRLEHWTTLPPTVVIGAVRSMPADQQPYR